MKALMISDHPKWCALMMNGDKTVEVRVGTALYKATQKLIDKYGYADFYVYCTKDEVYKMSVETELLTKIKEYVFEPKNHILCDNGWWCSLKDGYCPTYNCGALDKLKLYSDRQWLNTIRKIQNLLGDEISFEDLVEVVLHEMRYKRPSGHRK